MHRGFGGELGGKSRCEALLPDCVKGAAHMECDVYMCNIYIYICVFIFLYTYACI